ncbi:MAG TPA: hypothetical protein VFL57_07605 [Bryobacteraceae bacterium]|nr:hypothetical protein [Bryobacteraceae bacterium]
MPEFKQTPQSAVPGAAQACLFAVEQRDRGPAGQRLPASGGGLLWSKHTILVGKAAGGPSDHIGLATPEAALAPRDKGQVVDEVQLDGVGGLEAGVVCRKMRVELFGGLAGYEQRERGDVMLGGILRRALSARIRDRTAGFGAVAARRFFLFV